MRLAFDTAFSACSVALADPGGKVLAANHLEQRRGQAESLVPLIEKTLNEAGCPVRDVKEIVVTAGPGTFAGVRVGIACARALALANGARILALSSFEALAGRVIVRKKPKKGAEILTLVPGKRGEASHQTFRFTGRGQPGFEALGAAGTYTPEKIPESDANYVAGPKLESPLEEALGGKNNRLFPWPTAEDLLAVAVMHPKQAFRETASPFYLRPPDATPQAPRRGAKTRY